MMHSRLTGTTLAILSLASLCASPAPGAGAQDPLPEPTPPRQPLLHTTSEHSWTLSLRLEAFVLDFAGGDPRVFTPGATPHSRRRGQTQNQGIRVDRAAVVFPALTGSATHRAEDPAGTLRFDSDVADDTPEFLPGYQNGERLARWDAEDVHDANTMRLDINTPVVCRAVTFDETSARAIGWPAGPWPAVCASALEHQLGIDPGAEGVEQLVLSAVGTPPYTDPPVVIAKKLSAAVIQRFQPSGLGYEYDRAGRFGGIELNPIDEITGTMRGSPADMVALLCSAMRAAGVPARPVIGYDIIAAPEVSDEDLTDPPEHCTDRFEEGDALSLPRLTYWVEVALFDEAANTLEWIPVDVLRQRRVSSRLPALDEPWVFFGSHPCADTLVPMSFHFFPPTTVVGMGAPLLWGWIAEPEIPRLSQTMRVWASATPRTTNDHAD